MNKLPTKFSCLILPPKKTITILRVLLFRVAKREKPTSVTPFRHLRVHLEYKNGKRLRPVKIEFKEQGLQYIQPKRFIELLRAAQTVYIVADAADRLSDFTQMLADYQISYKLIDICQLCLLDNKISVLQKRDRYYRSRAVQFPMCFNCAMKEIIDESQFMGFKPNKKFLQQIEGLLRKKFHHDVNKILKVFEPGFNASKHPEFTLYDTIEITSKSCNEYPLNNDQLPPRFITALKKNKITTLMPIQHIAIQKGLLKGANLLISAPTGTGKTLIGELAGISKLYANRGGVLYLGNLVALVNQKYEHFKSYYPPFEVAIRVGMSKIEIGDEDLVIIDEPIQSADIICASYEGFEFLLRKGNEEIQTLGKISTIIIDELQTLEDEERGAILAGLIAKLPLLFKDAQIIALSATIGNAEKVARLLHMKPLIYNDRPVPIERHIVLCKSEFDKIFNLVQLVRHESTLISSYGHAGSTIIFTNARWRCEFLADLLVTEHGINAVAYHSGLTYKRRKQIEEAFDQGLIQAVVTTYALGAGFDTPCSQVIFESCLMGIDILTPNMFLNMSGRAGRFRRQDRGKIVLLVEIGKRYPNTDRTEDQIALALLESTAEPLLLDYNPDLIRSQVLSAFAAGLNTAEQIEAFYDNLPGAKEELSLLLKSLKKNQLISISSEKYYITTLGRAIAVSFFTIEEGLLIIRELNRGEDPLDIAIRLELFESIYILDEIKKIFQNEFKIDLPNKFFTGRIMGIAAVTKFKRRLKRKFTWLSKSIALWQKIFFTCTCGNAPYCDCPLLTMNHLLIKLRTQQGLTPLQISHHMEQKFKLKVYSGDLLRFFDNLIHRLQGIQRIAKTMGKHEIDERIQRLIYQIEKGRPQSI
ncbi:MAG: DUF5814 domain-containing protein [Candidatus Helarchaeota archaeon]